MKSLIGFLLLIVVPSASCFAAGKDHLFIKRYPDAKVRDQVVVDYESVEVVSPDGNKRTLTGDVHNTTYIVKGVSSLKVFENYKNALSLNEFTLVESCSLSDCGNASKAKTLGNSVAVKKVYNWYHSPYYIKATKQAKKGLVTLVLFIGSDSQGSVGIQQLIVEEEKLDLDLVGIDESYFGKDIPETLPVSKQAKDSDRDHAMLKRYPGAALRVSEKQDYETFMFPKLDASSAKGYVLEKEVGDLSRHYYIIQNASTLKVFENYLDAMRSAGFEIVDQCRLEACGKRNQAKALGDALSIQSVYNYYRKPYFIVGKKDNIKVGLFVGGNEDVVGIQQVILEGEALQKGLVVLTLDQMKSQLDETGKAVIYGIYFDTDKSTLRDESTPALEEIAKLLKKYPNLSIYVVGHTDDTGSLDHNVKLSQARSATVVRYLTQKLGIDKNRLVAAGVGPYAPASSNAGENGRSLNRRVELVKKI